MLSIEELEKRVNEQKEAEREYKLRDDFIDRTGRKNLQCQIKKLVQTAKDVYLENLEERRKRLQILLNSEDLSYEKEFFYKINAQVEENVRKRQESIISYEIEKEKERQEFVKMKKIQAYINNCDDIRLALREQILKETKMCNMTQIEEKHLRKLNEQAEECLWLQVRNKILEEQDNIQKYENCLKRLMTSNDRKALDQQMLQRQQQQEMDKQEALEERLKLQAQLKIEMENAASFEEAEKNRRRKLAEVIKQQLEEGIKQRKIKRQKDEYFECLFNQEVQRQKEHEEQLLKLKVSTEKEATLKYLQYLHEMKQESKAEKEAEDKALQHYQRRIECEQLKKVEEIKLKKKNEAKKAHQELLKQICDNEEKRLRQQQAEYESALTQRQIAQNEFLEQKAKEQGRRERAMQFAEELKKQIAEVHEYAAMAKKLFEEELQRAADEEDQCIILAKKYMEENIDYLHPHPNWSRISCALKEI